MNEEQMAWERIQQATESIHYRLGSHAYNLHIDADKLITCAVLLEGMADAMDAEEREQS